MRFSSYNILTRKLKHGGYVVLNSLSGLMDLIDEEAYELISTHSEEEELPQNVLDMLAPVYDHFLERGFLTELSPAGEYQKAKEHAVALEKESLEKGVGEWDVILIPNLGCNYRCPYCFEKSGGYPELAMSKPMVDAFFQIVRGKLAAGDTITLYGGEPLAKENRTLIEYIIAKGEEIGHSFFAVTNGHDLAHYMDLLDSSRIRVLQITVDGPKEIHDKRRISLDGVSSYDRIMSNIDAVLRDTDTEIRLKLNLDKRNIPFTLDLMEDLDKRGILDHPRFSATATQVVGVGDLEVLQGELRALEEVVNAKYPKFRDLFIGRTMVSNDMILSSLYLYQPIHRVSVCGVSNCSRIFCPDGSIYTCWSAVGHDDDIIGTFDASGRIEWNERVLDKWKRTTLSYHPACLKCKYGFLCAGGCRRPELPDEVSANAHDCDYFRNQFEDYLARTVEEYLAAGNK